MKPIYQSVNLLSLYSNFLWLLTISSILIPFSISFFFPLSLLVPSSPFPCPLFVSLLLPFCHWEYLWFHVYETYTVWPKLNPDIGASRVRHRLANFRGIMRRLCRVLILVRRSTSHLPSQILSLDSVVIETLHDSQRYMLACIIYSDISKYWKRKSANGLDSDWIHSILQYLRWREKTTYTGEWIFHILHYQSSYCQKILKLKRVYARITRRNRCTITQNESGNPLLVKCLRR